MLFALRKPLVLLGLATTAANGVQAAVAADDNECNATQLAHKYCIVGAGPAGVQLGEFLRAGKRDYIIVERAPHAGSFFAKLPVHRNLISINKRHTRAAEGSDQSDFALRHDWNSLLGGEGVPMFQTRTAEYWPHADTLTDYIQDFAARQVEAKKILFRHEVTRVSQAPADQLSRYVLDAP